MKGDKAVQYLATRIGQLELDKSLLLVQLGEKDELLHDANKLIEQLSKEVESWQQQLNPKVGESDI